MYSLKISSFGDGISYTCQGIEKKVICIPLEFRALENHVTFEVLHLNLEILLQTSLAKIRRHRVIKILRIPHTPAQHRGIFLREEFVTYS